MEQIIVDQPLEKEQIQMVVRRLRPRIVKHLIGMPFTDFTSLNSSPFGVDEDIARGLCPNSSPTDSMGKNR